MVCNMACQSQSLYPRWLQPKHGSAEDYQPLLTTRDVVLSEENSWQYPHLSAAPGGIEQCVQDTLYKLKISVDTPEGVSTIFRELAIPGSASLTELNDAILAAFGWAGVHKHEFVAASGAWKATDPQYGPPEFDDSYRSEEEVNSILDLIHPLTFSSITFFAVSAHQQSILHPS